MANYYGDNSRSIGRTPLVKLNTIVGSKATNEESFEYAKRLAKEEGILCRISSGAAAAVAARLSKFEEFEGKTIVVVLPDAGERYLSTPLFEGVGE